VEYERAFSKVFAALHPSDRSKGVMVRVAIANVYTAVYGLPIVKLRSTHVFDGWIDGLGDRRAANVIPNRLMRVQQGHLGDVKSVGDGVSEMRRDHGPGCRVYDTRYGDVVILLSCGDDKSSQRRDSLEAKCLAKTWKE
jgi:putative addiction module killer protein